MNDLSEALKQEETRLGRALTPIERLAFVPAGQRLGSKDEEDYRIILTETREGIALKKAFEESVQQAELVHNLQMRHTAVLTFNQAKRGLLRDFRAGEIERIKPKQD